MICCDHSAEHLAVTKRTLEERYPTEAGRIEYVRTASAGAELLGNRVDFSLSLLSLQHAVPQLQVAAVEHLCDILAPGGLGHVQALTHYDPAPYARGGVSPSARGAGRDGLRRVAGSLYAAARAEGPDASTRVAEKMRAESTSAQVQVDCDPALAIQEAGMQLHYLPLAEIERHLEYRGCAVLSKRRCDDMVAIPGRNSSSHCLTFFRPR